MRADLASAVQLFITNLWFFLLLYVFGVPNIIYLANPHGNYFSFILTHSVKTIFFMWKPLDSASIMEESRLLYQNAPIVFQAAIDSFLTEFVRSGNGILILGIVNLFKVLMFVLIWSYLLHFIWSWYNVIKP